MEQIRSVEEYKEAVRSNKQRLTAVMKNAVLMTNAIAGYISRGKLFRETCDNGLLLFLDEEAYYKLYYFWEEGKPLIGLRREKPVLVEELSSRGSRDEEIREREPFLFGGGFEYKKNNLQVEFLPGSDDCGLMREAEERRSRLEASGIALRYGEEKDMPEITKLWREYLDMTDIPGEHLHLTEDDKVLCAVDPSGRIVSTHWWRNTVSSSEGRHTVTHPDFYRRGLASALLTEWCADARKQGIRRCSTWITDTNHRSLAMYDKLGFRPNGRTSRIYLLQ